ncbi:MAG: nickel pincer cofactor biosynthesis protein LarC [Planctomycetes bacterium]|nr:nickel pincer cofactor biosynthesis protein LarC [Planctomycetota bacterium]
MIAFLDAQAGVAGDMWVAALLDSGLDLAPLRAAVASLGIAGLDVGAERVTRAGLAAARFVVRLPAAGPAPHRHLADVEALLARAAVPESVRARAVAVFRRLAAVEATVHGTTPDAIHFHEVGAEDALCDVLCACLGLELLGVTAVHTSTIEVGTGTVRCAHGELPVPAPGALGSLLGRPTSRRLPGERTTPTGAALIAELATAGAAPDLVPRRVGYGAGTRDDPTTPNVLRVTLADAAAVGPADGGLFELACNLDTATGEQLGWLTEEAVKRGAVDVWIVPIQMKKGRPGVELRALVDARTRAAVTELLLEESTTLGLRIAAVRREVLERWSETRASALGPVRVKCARLPSGRVVVRVEDDDLRRLCSERGIGRREVLARLADVLAR